MGEDLSRFPSESLHSFSFAHQTEDSLHNRQNLLKRSIDFMRDRFGWAASNTAIANAQAKVSGDKDVQNMMELLTRANLVGPESHDLHGLGLRHGPLTGPADVDGFNIFEHSFVSQTESPEGEDEGPLGPIMKGLPKQQPVKGLDPVSEHKIASTEASSHETTDDNQSTAQTSPTSLKRGSLKRTYTDLSPLTLQTKLMEALAQPYIATDQASVTEALVSPTTAPVLGSSIPSLLSAGPLTTGPVVHGHTSRWAPAAQAIFTTEGKAPWTILAANDLACLVFGVTKAEVRRIGILEVVREERRKWLEEKLGMPGADARARDRLPYSQSQRTSPNPTSSLPTSSLVSGNGVTAQLLRKPSSREVAATRRSQTDDGSGSTYAKPKSTKGAAHHQSNKSRGVLLCGDVVPILKRNGATGSASLWVKEKRGGLIWVLEEIVEDVATIELNDEGSVTRISGATNAIWANDEIKSGIDITRLIPHTPFMRHGKNRVVDYEKIQELRHFAGLTIGDTGIPLTLERIPSKNALRASSFPHIAGIMVLSDSTLEITSSNSVFSAALFGQERPEGLKITELIPAFDRILRILTEEDRVRLVDGMVIPEHSFRRARAILAMRDGKTDAAEMFFRPIGLLGRHRDGTEIRVDVQMRVVKSESFRPNDTEDAIEERSEDESEGEDAAPKSEVVYALWITYSRHIHAVPQQKGTAISPLLSRPGSPPHQPSPGQASGVVPVEMDPDEPSPIITNVSALTQQIQEAASQPIGGGATNGAVIARVAKDQSAPSSPEAPKKKTITDFVILEEMGQGAYGQVKLARYKRQASKKVVLKYVTKRRILVDTWTRDRRLGTVPLEIHVLDYLRRDGLKHSNIVEMSDFFEDDINYYIEMVPHGLPGMDLFDYIELRVNMEEGECRSIFYQVADALHHLHTKALVVHRDIKDENVVLDGEGKIKLIDFGSAAYIKNGPFDVFVGTIGNHPLLSI